MIVNFIVIALFFWLSINLIKIFFRQNIKYKQRTHSITVGTLHISYEFPTKYTAYARHMIKKHRHKWIGNFFLVGVAIMAIGNVLTPVYLVRGVYNAMYPTDDVSAATTYDVSSMVGEYNINTVHTLLSVAPIIPGVNFPLKYTIIFWIVTLTVMLVHEVGHAIAAIHEGLDVESFGVLFVFLFTGAYVNIESSIVYLPALPQIKVYSAGILMNILFSLLCYLLVFLLPTCLWMMQYKAVSGAIVSGIPSNSPLQQSLAIGNVIRSIGRSSIHSMNDYMNAIVEESLSSNRTSIPLSILLNDSISGNSNSLYNGISVNVSASSFGICSSSSMHIDANDINAAYNHHGCCKYLYSNDGSHSSESCFMHYRQSHTTSNFSASSSYDILCLPNVSMYSSDSAMHNCNIDDDCDNDGSTVSSKNGNSAGNSICLKQLSNSNERVVKIGISPNYYSYDDIRYMYYEGSLFNLLRSDVLTVGDYYNQIYNSVMVYTLFDNDIVHQCVLQLPEYMYFVLWLSIRLNLSVAIVNAMPAYTLDGNHAIKQMISLLYSTYQRYRTSSSSGSTGIIDDSRHSHHLPRIAADFVSVFTTIVLVISILMSFSVFNR